VDCSVFTVEVKKPFPPQKRLLFFRSVLQNSVENGTETVKASSVSFYRSIVPFYLFRFAQRVKLLCLQ
jgi:hypothetical protein